MFFSVLFFFDLKVEGAKAAQLRSDNGGFASTSRSSQSSIELRNLSELRKGTVYLSARSRYTRSRRIIQNLQSPIARTIPKKQTLLLRRLTIGPIHGGQLGSELKNTPISSHAVVLSTN